MEQQPDDHTFGKASRPRRMDPSMAEILSWPQEQLKSQRKCVHHCGENHLLKKSKDHFSTENRQEFRPFIVQKNGKALGLAPDIHPEHLDLKCSRKIKIQAGVNRSTLLSQTKDDFCTRYPKDVTNNSQDIKALVIQNAVKMGRLPSNSQIKGNQQIALAESKLINSGGQQLQSDRNNKGKKSNNKSKKGSRPKSHSNQKPQHQLSQKEIALKRRQARIKQFQRETRWLPNSAFKTYFGKAAFQAYGMSNVKRYDRLFQGTYMKSHNVMPHADGNKPHKDQCFEGALEHSKEIKCSIPRKYYENQVEQAPNKHDNQTKQQNIANSSSNIQGNSKNSKKIKQIVVQKPDLLQSTYFVTRAEAGVVDKRQPTVSHSSANNGHKRHSQNQTVPIRIQLYKQDQKQKNHNKHHNNTVSKTHNAKATAQTLLQETKKIDNKKVPQQLENSNINRIVKSQSVVATSKQAQTMTKVANKQNINAKKGKQKVAADGLKFLNERRKFMDELLKRKEQSLRIAPKITQLNSIFNTGNVLTNTDINNIPEEIYKSLQNNPKLYKGGALGCTDGIPQAGLWLKQSDHVKDLL